MATRMNWQKAQLQRRMYEHGCLRAAETVFRPVAKVQKVQEGQAKFLAGTMHSTNRPKLSKLERRLAHEQRVAEARAAKATRKQAKSAAQVETAARKEERGLAPEQRMDEAKVTRGVLGAAHEEKRKLKLERRRIRREQQRADPAYHARQAAKRERRKDRRERQRQPKPLAVLRRANGRERPARGRTSFPSAHEVN
jgi:hypothetical protein